MSKKLTKKEIDKLIELENKPKEGLERFFDWLEFSYAGLIPFWIWKGYGQWCGLRYVHKEVKWFFQRVFRGYADSDLWNLSYFLGNHIVKSLKAFKKMHKMGVPAEYTIDDKENNIPMNTAMKNWKRDIQDMIEGFEFLIDTQDEYDKLIKKCKGDYKKAGLEYSKAYASSVVKAQKFVQHFNNLWD